jgi:tetrahydromethanopterin S-methyltransferase subunit A
MHKKTKSVFIKDTKIIKGEYHPIKDWKMDKKGYFLIRINRRKKIIELGHCKKDNVIEVVVQGKTPQAVYFNACKMKLLSRLDHAAYLGKELEKAYLALKYRLDYVQDEELKI